MVRYKIRANENVRLNTFNLRLTRGEKITVESPTTSQINELERYDKSGIVRITKLEEEEMNVAEEDEEEDELDIDSYYCPECERTHYVDSEIGKKHLDKYLEEN